MSGRVSRLMLKTRTHCLGNSTTRREMKPYKYLIIKDQYLEFPKNNSLESDIGLFRYRPNRAKDLRIPFQLAFCFSSF